MSEPTGDIFAPFDPGPEPEAPTPAEYEVTGLQRIHEVAPGGTLLLDPEAPQTRRLLDRGAVRLRADQPNEE